MLAKIYFLFFVEVKIKLKTTSQWILMCFQCHMRVCVLWLAAKVLILIGSLVLIIGLFSTGLLKLQSNSTAWLPIRTDSLASITFCIQFLFPLVSEKTLTALLSCYFCFVVFLPRMHGCMWNISNVSSGLCQSAQRLSLVHCVTFSKCLQQRWKSHLTFFFLLFFFYCKPCDHSTICTPSSWFALLFYVFRYSLRSNSKPWPPAGTPSESANGPVCLWNFQPFFPCACFLPSSESVLTLQWLLCHLCASYDLSSPGSGRQLNFHCGSVCLVGKWCWAWQCREQRGQTPANKCRHVNERLTWCRF